MTYETGTEVFFIESNRIIRKATVVRRSGDFYNYDLMKAVASS